MDCMNACMCVWGGGDGWVDWWDTKERNGLDETRLKFEQRDIWHAEDGGGFFISPPPPNWLFPNTTFETLFRSLFRIASAAGSEFRITDP